MTMMLYHWNDSWSSIMRLFTNFNKSIYGESLAKEHLN